MIVYLLRRLGFIKNSPNAARGGYREDPMGQDWNRNAYSSSAVSDSDGDAAVIPVLMSGDAPDVCAAPSSDTSDSGSYSCSDSGSSSSDSGSSSSD
jgi:hypothetical protein